MPKNPPPNTVHVRHMGLITGLRRSPRAGNGNSLQYFCLENCMDREAWWATVHGVAKSWTRLKWARTHALQKVCNYCLFSMKVKVKSLSRVRLFATPWTVAHQAPLSIGFSRQEYCSGLSFSSIPNWKFCSKNIFEYITYMCAYSNSIYVR